MNRAFFGRSFGGRAGTRTATSPFIETVDLVFTYPGGSAPALRGVCLSIDQGEYAAVIGPNGSGKTTLLKHMNALLTPGSGRVLVSGIDTRDPEGLIAVRRRAAMVFQDPSASIIQSTVEEETAFGPENLGIPPREIESRVTRALEAVGLSALRERPCAFLSAGQKQLLALAAALAMEPRCLLLDEAGAMLDSASRDRLMAVLEELNAGGMTVVSVTQDMDEAARARRVIVMSEGRVVLDGSARKVFARGADLARIGLGLPRPAEFAARVREFVPGFPLGVLSVPGLAREVLRRAGGRSVRGGKGTGSGLSAGAAVPRAPRERTAAGGGVKRAGPGLVEIRDLSHFYNEGTPFETRSLFSVSLDIGPGEVIGIAGPNGSGKSTLLAHMNGLFRPRHGTVAVRGRSLCDPGVDIRAVRREVGLVFQSPEDQLFERFVGDDVAFGPKNLRLPAEEVRRRVREAMEAVGLPFAFKDRFTEDLSRGEKRRAAVAGVLALDPTVLVLDEPTANLDPAGKRTVLDLVLGWRNRGAGDRAVVIVSHDMDELAECADRLCLLADGRVVLSGAPREACGRPELLAAHGVRAPFGSLLTDELRRMGVRVGGGAVTIGEAARMAAELING